MKEEILFIQGLKREIKFYIGQNKADNFGVIDMGKPNDLWFHAGKGLSSCHVVCEMPEDITKKEMQYIIKVGANICKINTNKLKTLANVEIIYTKIKDVTKTKELGTVLTQNTKTQII